MQWYWWLIIVAAIGVFIPLKMKLTKAFLESQKAKQKAREKLMEEDE